MRGTVIPGTGFVDWLAEVVRQKRAAPPEYSAAAVAAGLNEMRSTGTRAFLDVDSLRASPDLVRAFPMPGIVFSELIAFDPARANSAVHGALDYQQETGALGEGQSFGLSPHAPYTTTRELLAQAKAAATALDMWLCIHAAETVEETEMLLHGRGPLYDFLHDAGVLAANWRAPGMRPIEYLADCGVLGPRTLLVHVNEAMDWELELVRDSGSRVVVCPGTHVFFGRGAFPLARLGEMGIRVYLGTDSLASNISLDMGREVDLACELCPAVGRDRIEAIADVSAARDFGLIL